MVEAIPKLEAIEQKYRYVNLEFLVDTYTFSDRCPNSYGQHEAIKIGYMLSPFGIANGSHWHKGELGYVIKNAEEFVNNHCINRYCMDYNGVYGVIQERNRQIEEEKGEYSIDVESLFTPKEHIPIEIDEITLDFHPTNNYIQLKDEV